MRTSHAAASGAFAGILIAIAICLMQEISLADSMFRALVLGASGAWMGMLLAWLDQMLTPKRNDNADDNTKNNRRHVS